MKQIMDFLRKAEGNKFMSDCGETGPCGGDVGGPMGTCPDENGFAYHPKKKIEILKSSLRRIKRLIDEEKDRYTIELLKQQHLDIIKAISSLMKEEYLSDKENKWSVVSCSMPGNCNLTHVYGTGLERSDVKAEYLKSIEKNDVKVTYKQRIQIEANGQSVELNYEQAQLLKDKLNRFIGPVEENYVIAIQKEAREKFKRYESLKNFGRTDYHETPAPSIRTMEDIEPVEKKIMHIEKGWYIVPADFNLESYKGKK